jgi:hypothetical protein
LIAGNGGEDDEVASAAAGAELPRSPGGAAGRGPASAACAPLAGGVPFGGGGGVCGGELERPEDVAAELVAARSEAATEPDAEGIYCGRRRHPG